MIKALLPHKWYNQLNLENRRSGLIVNALLFQIGWLACVLDGGQLALLTTLLIVITHGLLFHSRRIDFSLAAAAMGIGWLHETLLFQVGILSLPTGGDQVPVWLLQLWLLFALTLNHSMGWFMAKPVRIMAAGLFMAPISYYAGERLGAIAIAPLGAIPIGALWAISLLMLWIFHQQLIRRALVNA